MHNVIADKLRTCGLIGWQMTPSSGATLNTNTKPRHRLLRHIRLAPLGWHTRYVLRGYFRYTMVVTLGLLIVALAIDLTPRLMPILESRPEATGLAAVSLICRYIMLRTADILARNLPLTVYLGVLWFEFSHTLSSERVAVDVSGRSPLQCLVPALILSLGFGIVQLTIDLWLRPAAVMTQAAEKLGKTFGDQFVPLSAGYIHWVKLGSNLVSARIEYGPPPVLRNVTLYQLQPDAQPREVLIAQSAVPAALPSIWEFKEGFYWEWEDGQPSSTQAFEVREIMLDLDPKWLTNLNIDAKYLPQLTLQALASSANPIFPKSDYQTWIQVRHARGLFVLGMVLLAASLGQISRSRLPPLYGLLGMLLAGYIGHVTAKSFEIMGELDTVPPIVAGWFVPALLVLAATGVQLKISRKVG